MTMGSGMSAFEYHGKHNECEECKKLKEINVRLVDALDDAIQEVCDWASCADEYYQKKWDLDGKLKKLNEALASAKGEV